MGKTINVEDFGTVITCKGPNDVKVYFDGKEVRGLLSVTFTADIESYPETVVRRTVTPEAKPKQSEDILFDPKDRDFTGQLKRGEIN